MPNWEACTTTEPAPVNVRIPALVSSVAGPLTSVKATGRVDSAVALKGQVRLVVTCAGIGAKSMLWLIFVTSKDVRISVAGR